MTCRLSLLDESLIRARIVDESSPTLFTLPGLLAALGEDRISDFPALRPHQRHPWHAFLVQLAAIALHRAHILEPYINEACWRDALLALTPNDKDGAAWCLVTPPDRVAFMQAPVPGEDVKKWKNHLQAPDELDMLVTSKNHDLKASRMTRCAPDDWLFALLSLQTQEGVLGAGNYGISRMNGGYGSRLALGTVPQGRLGSRWQRDIAILLEKRGEIIELYGLSEDGTALVWVIPWDGTKSIPFGNLDPFYIEICRRIRLSMHDGEISAFSTGSKTARINAKQMHGQTGDPWAPIDISEGKALSLGSRGFDYKLATELVFGSGKYRQTITQAIRERDGTEGIVILAQGVARGQGKTEGYHERRIPISPKTRRKMILKQTDDLAVTAEKRIKAIATMRTILWSALATLFDNGKTTDGFTEGAKEKANRFVAPFESEEDRIFFTELNLEFEAVDPNEIFLQWLIDMSRRAEIILKRAFNAGPRSRLQSYRARSAALRRFYGSLHGEKSHLPILREYFRNRRRTTKGDRT